MVFSQEAKDKLHQLKCRYIEYKKNKDFIKNEKQIRQSLIDPFINKVLGYDPTDPKEVKVETRQNGKISDYIIFIRGYTM